MENLVVEYSPALSTGGLDWLVLIGLGLIEMMRTFPGAIAKI